jgi:hypothetical protein
LRIFSTERHDDVVNVVVAIVDAWNKSTQEDGLDTELTTCSTRQDLSKGYDGAKGSTIKAEKAKPRHTG